MNAERQNIIQIKEFAVPKMRGDKPPQMEAQNAGITKTSKEFVVAEVYDSEVRQHFLYKIMGL